MKSVLFGQGFGRKTPLEAEDSVKQDLTALSTILGDKPYLFGNRPSSVNVFLNKKIDFLFLINLHRVKTVFVFVILNLLILLGIWIMNFCCLFFYFKFF